MRGFEDGLSWALRTPSSVAGGICIAPGMLQWYDGLVFLLALKWNGISIKRGTLANALAFALVRCEEMVIIRAMNVGVPLIH